ncbi:sigma-54-dependent Fis family transcriptional regulator [Nocardioides sp.]|uniref:sigma-54-dependent Fis family transcriptional regulator n=1 Tax=Nocardioides sp. TaxID=35761 RepID=UPI002727514A|nr:helix-turn-helix domain-containing protein [Nocardioides sp.]MDO9457600.1 helix-turn-helix domain-containing protein [Nocardioides sp.]
MPRPATSYDDLPDARPDIAASWRRASLAGVDRTGSFERLVPGDIDRHSSLLVGAAPVLEQLESSLAGTGYSTILGDRECRIVRRWFDDPTTREGFDLLNIREGASMLEDTIGTNGLGTVFETRHPVVIHGPEHFAESLRRFSCYGHPIRHPLTRRIEGVLDISAVVETASPLLPPLIARAVHDIEQRLLGGSRISEKSLLAAFQEASGHSRHAVLAIGESIVMCNQAASDLLSSSDIALLRVLAEDPPGAGESALRVTLETGRPADVTVTRVPGARRGVLLQVAERATGPHLTPTTIPTTVPLRAPAPTLVSGPPGTGRSTRARELAVLPAKVMRAATALLEGEAAWAQELERAMKRSGGSVVVDGIDLLSDELLDLVIELVDRRTRPQLVLTSGPVEGLTGRAATLAATAITREVMRPLASRRTEIPDLAVSMLGAVAASDSVHLTPGALHALAAHDWPGNLRELKAVIAHAAALRSCGGIALTDLPEPYRVTGPAKPLAGLDRAEHDAIVAALRAADGNKVQAARDLGVSRTTLYARIRQLRITGF